MGRLLIIFIFPHVGIHLYTLYILSLALHISDIGHAIDKHRFIQYWIVAFVLIIGH